ncbi:hypothetical protein PV327_009152 [Microctonus hyperodae]|uniref:Uncharacterized protein n=1 Tax=Microctonus hyperodae TaxID=165561 RepID=A0AA39FTN6_MICHY|nr:hypothetical protein PV327_009152 [Microctonus hyperodae]
MSEAARECWNGTRQQSHSSRIGLHNANDKDAAYYGVHNPRDASSVDSGYETTAELIFARLLTVVTMHCDCWWLDLLSIRSSCRHTKFVNEWLSENVVVVNTVKVVGITWDLLYYSQTKGNRKAPSLKKLRPRDTHLELLIRKEIPLGTQTRYPFRIILAQFLDRNMVPRKHQLNYSTSYRSHSNVKKDSKEFPLISELKTGFTQRAF